MGERGMHFHANQDLDELEGLEHLVLDTSHAAVAGHDPSRGAAPVRAAGSARAPVGQRREGVGLPPSPGRRRARSRRVHARAHRRAAMRDRSRWRSTCDAAWSDPVLLQERYGARCANGAKRPRDSDRALTASLPVVRRPTFIMIIVLFVIIAVAAMAQIVIASGEGPSPSGADEPGQLPSTLAVDSLSRCVTERPYGSIGLHGQVLRRARTASSVPRRSRTGCPRAGRCRGRSTARSRRAWAGS